MTATTAIPVSDGAAGDATARPVVPTADAVAQARVRMADYPADLVDSYAVGALGVVIERLAWQVTDPLLRELVAEAVAVLAAKSELDSEHEAALGLDLPHLFNLGVGGGRR